MSNKTLPQTLNEATEMLQRMLNKPAHLFEIREMFKGCMISFKGGPSFLGDKASLPSSADNYKVTALPLEQVSVITEQPKRMMQDDYAGYSSNKSLSVLGGILTKRLLDIRMLGDNTLNIINGEGGVVNINAKYYAPKIIEDKQQEILAIVARMRDLLTDIAKENGSF